MPPSRRDRRANHGTRSVRSPPQGEGNCPRRNTDRSAPHSSPSPQHQPHRSSRDRDTAQQPSHFRVPSTSSNQSIKITPSNTRKNSKKKTQKQNTIIVVTCAAHPAFTPATIVNRALGKAPAPAVRKLITLGTATRYRHGEYGAPLGAPTERLCGEFHRTRTLHRFRRCPTRTHNANDLRLCTCPDFQPRSHAPRRRHLPLQGALSTAGSLAKKKQGRARQHTPSSAPPHTTRTRAVVAAPQPPTHSPPPFFGGPFQPVCGPQPSQR
jgi:hypothetical protein